MLRIPRRHLDAMQAHARRDAPREACGVLGGVHPRGAQEEVEVRVVVPCRNAAAAPQQAYTLHPDDQLRAFMDIEDAHGLEVVGFYHSHPRGPAGPSAADAALATYPGAVYVVLWTDPGQGRGDGVGAWRWHRIDGFQPLAMQVDAGEPARERGNG